MIDVLNDNKFRSLKRAANGISPPYFELTYIEAKEFPDGSGYSTPKVLRGPSCLDLLHEFARIVESKNQIHDTLPKIRSQ